MENQSEFLFADGEPPLLGTAAADDPLVQDIARAWSLPIGQRVRVHLKPDENLPLVEGRLELAAAPDLPFDGKGPLELRIRGYVFSSRAIAAWVRLAGGDGR